jgi:hypothetical protein
MKGSVAWLVPAPLRGSGGHRTIFQNVNALAEAGCDCHVFVEAPPADAAYDSAESARALVESYFGAVRAKFHVGFDLDRDFDVAFATAWFTAAPLKATRRAHRKAYFVQDYEAYFMPMSDGFLMAENSFRFGFAGATIGRWLTHRLGNDFDMYCAPFDFCADRAVYRPLPDVRREKAICFVYQPEKPRRCSLIGGQALAIVKHEMPDVKIYFYGNDARAPVSFPFEHCGLVSIEQCNELYNKTTVGLCISATNPSRIPFEMMAAGLPVVDVYRENTLYDLPDDAVVLAEPTPESIAYALLGLLRDPAACAARSAAGIAFMQDRDLARGYGQFTAFVEKLLTEPVPRRGELPTKLYQRPMTVAPPHLADAYHDILTGAAAARAARDPVARAAALVSKARARFRKLLGDA